RRRHQPKASEVRRRAPPAPAGARWATIPRRVGRGGDRVTRSEAVAAKCRECIYDPCAAGNWREQVADCCSAGCPLFDFRPVPKLDGHGSRDAAIAYARQKIANMMQAGRQTAAAMV